MANDTNLCLFTGRLGKDSETRFLPNGNAVCNFSMAVGRSWKDQQGQWQEKTTWINCALFGKGAEHYGPKLLKGSQWFIHADYSEDEWEKDGQKHRRPKFTVQKIQAIGGKVNSDASHNGQTKSVSAGQASITDDFDDDIPW